ncbi:heavy-metal-associated domain-containing protein [Pseudonocardia bannensis]|uniref:Heavy-metal-associated domain-containing protein n=2 Tax=Pseudonocardiaceae TaxID=2070 RepID=A0A848DHS1_9PSEU|nr:heavy-metal-associated domain-containing protein [Pseudonocardia bannensis]
MTCEHCVRAISSSVGDVAGVTAVQVDLATTTVHVSGAAAPEQVRAAIADAGYQVAP